MKGSVKASQQRKSRAKPQIFSHAWIDERNRLQDRLLARELRRSPHLLRLAQRNLRRWMKRDGSAPRPVFLEWHRILTRLTRYEIAEFLLSDTPMCCRLRQSTPFLGLFPEKESPHK